MIIDFHNQFSAAQALTATAASDNIIDLGPLTGGTGTNLIRDIGNGQDLFFVAVVTTAFTDAGSDSTITVTIEADALAAFGSPTTVQTIGTFAALSAAGTMLAAKLQPSDLWERFIRAKYTTANGDLTTGAVTSFLTTDLQSARAYAKGYTIS